MPEENLQIWFNNHQEKRLFHRYINLDKIDPILHNLSQYFKVAILGYSVKNSPIHCVEIGTGSIKILMWSQMHGNESTTTKALFDVMNTIKNVPELNSMLSNVRLYIIPMLNPDGAAAYTRVNANGVDLNRDAQELKEPESKVLRDVFNTVKPDFCFNLHGQRTIFGAGTTGKSATVSFLAPAQDNNLTITPTRLKAMAVINYMNSQLQKIIPNQIGLYDDAFNMNCVGDTFQSFNVPTVLFEAGHYKNDYSRETTRYFIYNALINALKFINNEDVLDMETLKNYTSIPLNNKCFFDIIFRNVKLADRADATDVAIQYKEYLNGQHIYFMPQVEKIGSLHAFYGHKEINGKALKIETHTKQAVFEGYENDFVLLKNEKTSLLP